MAHVVPLAPVYTLAVAGYSEDRFPVNRVFCVGRNYAAHAREMGKDPEREAPFFFHEARLCGGASGYCANRDSISTDDA